MTNPTLMMWKIRLMALNKHMVNVGNSAAIRTVLKILWAPFKLIGSVIGYLFKNPSEAFLLFIIIGVLLVVGSMAFISRAESTMPGSASYRLRESDRQYAEWQAASAERIKKAKLELAEKQAKLERPMPPDELKNAILEKNKVCMSGEVKKHVKEGNIVTYGAFNTMNEICEGLAEKAKAKAHAASLLKQQEKILKELN